MTDEFVKFTYRGHKIECRPEEAWLIMDLIDSREDGPITL